MGNLGSIFASSESDELTDFMSILSSEFKPLSSVEMGKQFSTIDSKMYELEGVGRFAYSYNPQKNNTSEVLKPDKSHSDMSPRLSKESTESMVRRRGNSAQDPEDFPASACAPILGLYRKFQNAEEKESSGTAYMIGPCVMLTAAHNVCFFSEDDKKMKYANFSEMEISFGVLGSAKIQNIFVPKKYFKIRNEYFNENDFAFVILDKNIGLKTGWIGLADLEKECVGDLKAKVMGFPDNSGRKSFFSDSHGQLRFSSENKRISYLINTYRGQSGGPVIVSFLNLFFSLGIHTNGFDSPECVRFSRESYQSRLKVKKSHSKKTKSKDYDTKSEVEKVIEPFLCNSGVNFSHIFLEQKGQKIKIFDLAFFASKVVVNNSDYSQPFRGGNLNFEQSLNFFKNKYELYNKISESDGENDLLDLFYFFEIESPFGRDKIKSLDILDAIVKKDKDFFTIKEKSFRKKHSEKDPEKVFSSYYRFSLESKKKDLVHRDRCINTLNFIIKKMEMIQEDKKSISLKKLHGKAYEKRAAAYFEGKKKPKKDQFKYVRQHSLKAIEFGREKASQYLVDIGDRGASNKELAFKAKHKKALYEHAVSKMLIDQIEGKICSIYLGGKCNCSGLNSDWPENVCNLYKESCQKGYLEAFEKLGTVLYYKITHGTQDYQGRLCEDIAHAILVLQHYENNSSGLPDLKEKIQKLNSLWDEYFEE